MLARYLNLPADARPETVTAGASGSLFVVSNVIEPSGRPQIRVLKIDSDGATLASIDFGGSSRDTIAGAAVDATGNLVVVGSTSSADFPLVSPLISSTSSRRALSPRSILNCITFCSQPSWAAHNKRCPTESEPQPVH